MRGRRSKQDSAICKAWEEGKPIHIGLIDADLLYGGTRHPNLALLKIAGYLRDNGFERNGFSKGAHLSYELITIDLKNEAKIDWLVDYDRVYLSRVFSFTKLEELQMLQWARNSADYEKKVIIGGTGTYAMLSVEEGFSEERCKDMERLEKKDGFLALLHNKSGECGINMRTQMPDYHLYDDFVNTMIATGKTETYFKDYRKYSIGFLTRGCFRKCPFCVNKLEKSAIPYSDIDDFLDQELDEKGKLVRPYIYLWDDNFLASPHWKELLLKLQSKGRPFQFRQGLDERLLAQNRNGEDMARLLASSNYHGDFIFAFDNWYDRDIIEDALNIWKHYCPKKETKFYLFCGFHQSKDREKLFQQDIAQIFMRIKILMKYGCLGYIMRHEDYKQAPIENIYVQIARWCNQPGFYRNMSFWDFCYKNQTFWEKQNLGHENMPIKTYEEFLEDYNNGYYTGEVKLCKPLETFKKFMDTHKAHKRMFLSFFTMRKSELQDSNLWKTINTKKRYKKNKKRSFKYI